VKALTLVRHGRAEPHDRGMTDFERPLDRRGVREATEMSRRLAELGVTPDCILASPARRTRQTATIFARELEVPERRVLFEERLYLAPAEELLAALRSLGPRVGHALLVGHNPGLTEFLQRLAPEAPARELATGAVCRLTLTAPNWGELGFGCGRDVSCEAPKRLFGS